MVTFLRCGRWVLYSTRKTEAFDKDPGSSALGLRSSSNGRAAVLLAAQAPRGVTPPDWEGRCDEEEPGWNNRIEGGESCQPGLMKPCRVEMASIFVIGTNGSLL